ncbi:MAG: alkaline phosphatase family protein, partial [Planctomycetaceae bacterium]|nr:alkaline phosphatase family protein [Planctomycetaceae bacterium]
MKHSLFSIALAFIFTTVSFAADVPKTLVVMLDGARPDAILMAKTPNINAICDGSWANGYHGAYSFAAHTIKDAATVSAPNHTAIATGVTTSKNKVDSNKTYGKYVSEKTCATYKNFLTRIKERDSEKKTAFVFSWKPDRVLVSDDNPCDIAIDGSDEANAKQLPAIINGTFESATWKKGTDIDAILYYIDVPDHVGHSGGFSPPATTAKHTEYVRCFETIDGWFGTILDAIRKRSNFANEDWLIVITSDHGGWVGTHGPMRADNFTIPFIVSSKQVKQGEIIGQPCNTDAAVTALDHFGFDTDTMKKDGLLDGNV